MAMEKGEERENVARWTPNDEPTESSTEKLIRKSKKEPFIPIGKHEIIVFLILCLEEVN